MGGANPENRLLQPDAVRVEVLLHIGS